MNKKQQKNCPLLGITENKTIQSVKQHYQKVGYDHVEVYSMLDIYNKFVDQIERKRIEKIEFLDELEEWNIMMGHYFISLTACWQHKKNIEMQFKKFIDIVKISK